MGLRIVFLLLLSLPSLPRILGLREARRSGRMGTIARPLGGIEAEEGHCERGEL